MVIRRIREHVAHHNWFAVAIDLVIVVVGVFLGTQANNWNQGRIDHARGQAYRERLAADLAANQDDYGTRRRYEEVVRAHALAALDAVERPAGPGDGQFLIDLFQASQINPRHTLRSTYDEIVSVGGLESVGGATLRRTLANFYVAVAATSVTFDNVPPYREHLRSAMPYAVQRNVVARCPETISFAADSAATLTLARSCSLDLLPSEIAAAAAKMRHEPKLVDELTRLAVDLDSKINIYTIEGKRVGKVRLAVLSADKSE